MNGLVKIREEDRIKAQERALVSLQKLRKGEYKNGHVSGNLWENERAIFRGALGEVLFERITGASPIAIPNSLWDSELEFFNPIQGVKELLKVDVKTATISRNTDIMNEKLLLRWNLYIQARQVHEGVTYVSCVIDEKRNIARVFISPWIRGEVILKKIVPVYEGPGNYIGKEPVLNYKVPYRWFMKKNPYKNQK